MKRGSGGGFVLILGVWGVSLCEMKGCLLLFGAAKSNQKLLVAEKASAFIAKRSLQKQNSSPFRTPQTVVFVTLPYSLKARFTFSRRRSFGPHTYVSFVVQALMWGCRCFALRNGGRFWCVFLTFLFIYIIFLGIYKIKCIFVSCIHQN